MRDLLFNKIRAATQHPQFVTDVMKPMMIEQIYDQEVRATCKASAGSFVMCMCAALEYCMRVTHFPPPLCAHYAHLCHPGHCPQVAHLSGGEMQRVALVLALGKPADIYLIDEPSAYLDSEQRIVAAKVIKRCGFVCLCVRLALDIFPSVSVCTR